MKSKGNLIKKIWLYLTIFSVSILSFLWLFQVIFLDAYYIFVKKNDVKVISNEILNNYESANFEEILDLLTFNKDVCIDIIYDNTQIYSSNGLKKRCINSIEASTNYNKYVNDFILSGLNNKAYTLKDSRFGTRIVIEGIKLRDKYYAFVTTSLEPLTAATSILISQLIYVTILVLLFSFIIGYFVSKKISNPILEINKNAKKMSKGNYNFTFKTDSNISEIIELTDTLESAKNELEKTDDLRRELLANVSHDLKTPLTMIKAYTEMVRDITYKDKEKRENNLNTIIEEVDRLNLLVNDILELSKAQAGVNNLEIKSFDLNELIKKIIKRFDCFDIKFEYQEKNNLFVLADESKIEQVIYNLISNAINYVGKDKIVIINVNSKKDTYLIEIIDHGKGIKEDEIDKIWDKYYKIDKSHKRNNVGTGLGLSIVKGILKNHDFIYGVKSKVGVGTTFYFEINKDKKYLDK